eukprot:SAG22_NODE_553_length_9168_cov_5.758628_12_plen_120_part_00
MIREMFGFAKDHAPCVIFMDEVDAIGGRRLSEGTSADREIQRTLMELLNQLDGFDDLGRVKIIMGACRNFLRVCLQLYCSPAGRPMLSPSLPLSLSLSLARSSELAPTAVCAHSWPLPA